MLVNTLILVVPEAGLRKMVSQVSYEWSNVHRSRDIKRNSRDSKENTAPYGILE